MNNKVTKAQSGKGLLRCFVPWLFKRFFPPCWKPRLYGRQDARRYTPHRAKLFHLFDDEPFDERVGGHKFETELVKDGLFERFRLRTSVGPSPL